MRIPKLLLCEDDIWERENLPGIIESSWKDMFAGEQVEVHGCSDVVREDRPRPPIIPLDKVGQYDALLLDIWWGKPSSGSPHGVEIAETVRRRYPEMPIIVFSRHVSLEDFQSLIPHGIAGYLTKTDPTAQTWCAEIHRVLETTGRERSGHPLYQLLRHLLAETPNAWCRNEVDQAASEVWRHENPYQKWEQFWGVWVPYLGQKRINIPCDDIARFFAKEELLTISVGEALRGHLEHVLHVYFTGYIISHVAPGFRDHVLNAVRYLLKEDYREDQTEAYWDMFQASWLVAATLHDAAYPLEILPDVVHEASQIQDMFPFAQLTPTIPSVAPSGVAWNSTEGRAARDAFRFVLDRLYDNTSALRFVQANALFSDGKVQRFNHGVASGACFMKEAQKWGDLPNSLPLVFLQWAATAMALHALKHAAEPNGVCIALQRDPLSFLLALCDELQVWNRSRPDETPTSSDFRRVDLHAMEFDGNKLSATIEYDLFPLVDTHRQKKAVNAITSRLSKDQRLMKIYLKPELLGVEILSRIRDPFTELPPILLGDAD